MAGSQIDILPHKTDKCNTNSGLKVFVSEDGRVTGYCFACGTYIPDPYGDGRTADGVVWPAKKTEAQIQAEIAEVETYQTLNVLSRKLKASTLKQFGAYTSLSEQDGVTPTAIYWPVTKNRNKVGYYVKMLSKDIHPYFIGDAKDSDPFGWDEALKSGAYKLIITEGPEDMAAVKQLFDIYGDEKWIPAVISLPKGAGSAKKTITKYIKDIQNFKEVIFCFDDDEPGQKALADAMVILPTAKSVVLPYKDANECLLQGAGKQAYNALSYRAATPKNTRIVYAESLHEAAREPAKWGEYTWPFPKLNDLTRGLRLGETLYGGAGVKMGKGELRNEVAAHLIMNHNAKVFMVSPEESNSKTYKLCAGKLASRRFNDPKIEFDYKAYDKAGEVLKSHLALLNLYQHVGWNSLKEDIKAAADWGAKIHFVDPITNLVGGIGSGEANTELERIAQEGAALAMDLNILIIWFCHLKAPEGQISPDVRDKKYASGHYIGIGNCPHEMGGDIYSTQFAGSRAMMRSCNMMFGLEGNKDPNLPDNIRNRRRIKILEDREFGETGTFDLYWDKNTGRFTEL
jgi:twinkle protein